MNNIVLQKQPELLDSFSLNVTKGFSKIESISYNSLVSRNDENRVRKWIKSLLKYYNVKKGDSHEQIREKMVGCAIEFYYTGGEWFVKVFVEEKRRQFELFNWYFKTLQEKFPENIKYNGKGNHAKLLIKYNDSSKVFAISYNTPESNVETIEDLKSFIKNNFYDKELLIELNGVENE